MKLVVHEAASAELEEAAEWYDSERAGLGNELLEEMARAVEAILEAPRTWPIAEKGRSVRKFTLSRFPYAAYYVARGEEVLVVAFGHTSRRPGYWRERARM